MRAASQLPAGGPLLWIWPLYLHVNKKSDDDDDDDDISSLDQAFHMKYPNTCIALICVHTDITT